MTLLNESQPKQSGHDTDQHKVSCEECYKDVPVSIESEDYVAYFCGLGCYNLWKKKHKSKNLEDDQVYVYQDPELG